MSIHFRKHYILSNGQTSGNDYIGYINNSDYANTQEIDEEIVRRYQKRGYKNVSVNPVDGSVEFQLNFLE
jgi:ABC-type sulfate transport system substrate-binding protein